jgi:hypothetical protein
MKLSEFSLIELEKLEKDLEFDSRRMMDKHKAWEASQKLKLVRAELERRRNPLGSILKQIQNWFDNQKG